MKACWTLLLPCILTDAFAQIPNNVRDRLARDGVVVTDAWIFASASGPIRGSLEGYEQFQATRAMSAIARSLCKFEPRPGRRLEAGVTGFSMVSSIQRGSDLEIIMRAPVQSPLCKVTVTENNLVLPEAHRYLAPKEQVPESDLLVQITPSGYIRDKNMTVRMFNREY
jgi:hypothetical protein